MLVIAGAMALHSLDINIAPLLAGAGVVGLALSLGAQTLIKDYIGGILILVENQFTTGDTIKVGSVTGSVERITLRATWTATPVSARVALTNGQGAFMRERPGRNGQIIAALSEGTSVQILYQRETIDDEEWVEVRDLLGRTGWIMARFLQAQP